MNEFLRPSEVTPYLARMPARTFVILITLTFHLELSNLIINSTAVLSHRGSGFLYDLVLAKHVRHHSSVSFEQLTQ